MPKLNLTSTCLMAAFVAALAGCQTAPRQGEAPGNAGPARASAQPAASTPQAPASEARSAEREAPVRERRSRAGTAFSADDAAAIRDFYRQGNPAEPPSGRIAKLSRGAPYPFGYTWRALPPELENRLAPLAKGYTRVAVGQDVGILDVRTRIVMDVVENAGPAAPARQAKAARTRGAVAEAKAPVAAEAKTSIVVERKAPPAAPRNAGEVAFSAEDAVYIRDFYGAGNPLGKTAGRVTKAQRGAAYPFGYTWRPLPTALENHLSPLPKGYARVLIGTDVGILDVRTRVVVDLLENPAA